MRPPETIQTILSSPLLKQFLRFASVGLVATAMHYAVLIALVEGPGWPTVPATTAGFFCGALVSYGLNQWLTFDARPALLAGFSKFIAFGAVGAALNAAIVAGLTALSLHYLLAQATATGLVLFWNFFSSRHFVFRP